MNWMSKLSLPAVMMGAAVLVCSHAALSIPVLEIGSMARKITVRIDGAENGSGIIIARRNDNQYLVLTNWHVVEKEGQYQVYTADGQSYPVLGKTQLGGIDLALIAFSSPVTYTIASKGNSDDLMRGNTVHFAGYTERVRGEKNRNFHFSADQIILRFLGENDNEDGYEIVYTGELIKGMSGGPLLNNNGELIGIIGQANIDPYEKHLYAIPINTALKWANRKGFDLTPSSAESSSPTPTNPTPTALSSPIIISNSVVCQNNRLLTFLALSTEKYYIHICYQFAGGKLTYHYFGQHIKHKDKVHFRAIREGKKFTASGTGRYKKYTFEVSFDYDKCYSPQLGWAKISRYQNRKLEYERIKENFLIGSEAVFCMDPVKGPPQGDNFIGLSPILPVGERKIVLGESIVCKNNQLLTFLALSTDEYYIHICYRSTTNNLVYHYFGQSRRDNDKLHFRAIREGKKFTASGTGRYNRYTFEVSFDYNKCNFPQRGWAKMSVYKNGRLEYERVKENFLIGAEDVFCMDPIKGPLGDEFLESSPMGLP